MHTPVLMLFLFIFLCTKLSCTTHNEMLISTNAVNEHNHVICCQVRGLLVKCSKATQVWCLCGASS